MITRDADNPYYGLPNLQYILNHPKILKLMLSLRWKWRNNACSLSL